MSAEQEIDLEDDISRTEHTGASVHSESSSDTLLSAETEGSAKPPQDPLPLKHIIPNFRKLPRRLRRYQKTHAEAIAARPNTRIANHRYWIVVIHPGRHSSQTAAEKKYTWFKGNRLTTVYTVSRIFEQKTFIDDFVLLLNEMRITREECMESLDLMNNKLIVLQCVLKTDDRARGVPITKFLVPQAQIAKGVKKPTEVIVLDDD